MGVPSDHRASPELAAWLGGAILVAGLGLTSSFPRAGGEWSESPPRTLAAAAETITSALGRLLPQAPERTPAYLRPDCRLFPVPDPREVAAVARGLYHLHPGAVVTVRPTAGPAGAVSVCEG
ncbi:hypothetical protein [Naasia sp. SYSU D00948]|uniref:hypothetical protein n=1 Tax=Naasia sp. SYSU D00948 TaxID=2817379 RepID=UPI001B3182C0|nr:hypothetical protein [Naasia sp. SYSU D00948]